ncbi:MAG: FMN-binding negative transcriptional regulator [Chloroflexi bacterium]|nr:FMN-binding negative transcriptional regulator [Chloroflexota bacterium]MCC6895275.1 FMN-binding negative transcriptional regulator [Anaerolineae bacterium]
MYTPKQFEMNDPAELTAFMQQYNFAALVTNTADGLTATHLPFMLDSTRGQHGTLIAHLAKPNLQWKHFANGQEALVIFTGPHAYVSPNWYEKPQTNVPTWNYTAVHAYGIPRVMEDPQEIYAMLDQLVVAHEVVYEKPWVMQSAEEHVRRLIGGIVGFEMTITRVEGKAKLSQNRSEADRYHVEQQLAQSHDSLASGTAALMQAQREQTTEVS